MSIIGYDEPEIPDDLFECALLLRNTIVGLTTEGGSDIEYKLARKKLMDDPACKRLLPDFVRYSNDAMSVRSALSSVASGSGSWALRRKHVNDHFLPILKYLESGGGGADAAITDVLTDYDAPAVQAFWTKALERRATDPEGAVTAASTLLEEVCKHIIEDSGGDWGHRWNVPKLYAEASKALNLAPSQHQEEVFKTILGSCQSVVQSIGSLRNKGGDAHAGGRSRVPFKSRHAALTVNLAGSMALFLIETWQARVEEGETSTK
ncbi:abortive infection family protein [Aliiroseovarius sp. S1339]|uniref:abortive infection family protein n=1 Tax=Aliiroseovarius sp. S1339 TaxID=2936990 RepID=UPI0020C1730A|nr:abortive infection family protein [Aliiroseovarius sp. S1339]MCK8464134.1 abortive infection family protein [Aliiroseovarius sp. S1339]